MLLLVGGTTSWLGAHQLRVPSQHRSAAAIEMVTVFIDGEAGTTGLEVRNRLAKRTDVTLITLDDTDRKDVKARAEAFNAADAAILCLPDAAAIEAVSLVDNDRTVLIDASTAHRINPEWAYGFPELNSKQRSKIAASKRIANPGCYATGFIALTHPLTSAGLLRPDAALVASAVSGYSGGGKALMGIFEGAEPHEPWGAYGFNLEHKHLPEMQYFSGLADAPIFLPAVGLTFALTLTLTLTLTLILTLTLTLALALTLTGAGRWASL